MDMKTIFLVFLSSLRENSFYGFIKGSDEDEVVF